MRRSREGRWVVYLRGPVGCLIAAGLAVLLTGCATGGATTPGASPRTADASRAGVSAAMSDVQQRALLLLMADQKRFEPFTAETALAGGAALREQLALTLGRVGDPRGVTYLGQLAGAAEPEVRRAAVFAFGLLELERADAERAALSLLLVAVEDDREAAALAVEALGKLGVSVTEVTAAMERAELPETERWARLLPALYRYDEPAMPAVARAGLAAMTAAVAEGDPDAPLAPASAAPSQGADLSLTGGDAGTPAGLRRRAAFALARTPQAEALPDLRALLGDGDERVRAWAARGLGLIGEGSDLAPLRQVATGDPAPGPRIQAVRAAAGLAAAGDVPAVEAAAWRGVLLALMDHPDHLVRLEALDRAGVWLAAGGVEAGLEVQAEDQAQGRGALTDALEAKVTRALAAAPPDVSDASERLANGDADAVEGEAGASGEEVAPAPVGHEARVALAEGAAALLSLAEGAPETLTAADGTGLLGAAAASASDLLRATSADALGRLTAAGVAGGAAPAADRERTLRRLLADPAPAVSAAAASALLAAVAPAGDAVPDEGAEAEPPEPVTDDPAALALAGELLRHRDEGIRTLTLAWLEEHPVMPYVELTRALQAERAGGSTHSYSWDAQQAAVGALAGRGEAEPRERGGVVAVLEKLAAGQGMTAPSGENVSDGAWLLRRTAGEALARLGQPVPPIGHPRGRRSPAVYEQIVRRTATPRVVDVETEAGTLRLRLDCPRAPLTCLNFLQLAGQGYFDGVAFHRVVPDFVVQGGDPRGDGTGGPGYALRDEINRRRYVRGALGMALSGPDTGGSQFFLTHVPQPHLDGGYTVFGELVSGGEVLDRITRGTRILGVSESP